MYAVIIAGGKQYRVEVGQVIKIDKIEKAIGKIINSEGLNSYEKV
jgi:ribosomal protein L21